MFIALIEKIRYLSVFLSILYLTFFIKKKTNEAQLGFGIQLSAVGNRIKIYFSFCQG